MRADSKMSREAAALKVGRLQHEADAKVLRMAEDMAGIGRWSFDIGGQRVVWSDEVYRVHGVTPETFTPDLAAVLECYHPEDRAVLTQMIGRAVGAGEGYECKLRLKRISDGADRTVMAKAMVELDRTGKPARLFGVFQDVTEHETALALIAESEARYRMLADASTDIILRIAPDGVIRFCSLASRIFGYEPEEIVGMKTIDLVHPDDLPHALSILAEVFEDKPIDRSRRREYRVRRKDGGYIWLEGNPSAVRDDTGAVIEIVSVFRDVTARRKLEDDLAEARDEAQAAARAKADFLANMSHELRTPLTSVIGFAGLLRDMSLPKDAARYVQRVGTASAALMALINDVLDFSKLEAGALELDPVPANIASLTAEVCDLLSLQADAKGLYLHTDFEAGADASIMIDDLRFRQVLNNLIGNAVKFTADGGVTVALSVHGDGSQRRLRLEVRDTGPGLEPAVAASLFARFAQADASIGRRHGGSGLGLSICRQLAAVMGGRIGVDSTPGRGSTFWFEAPAALCRTTPALKAVQADRGEMAVSGARVLVVDDHPVNRELVRALLTGLDLSLTEAASGAEAVEACGSSPFDLVLMDMQMPGMDGLTASRTIRDSGGLNADTPIVALTAMTMSADDEDICAAGIDDVLAKPIDPGLLLAKISRWLASGAPETPSLSVPEAARG